MSRSRARVLHEMANGDGSPAPTPRRGSADTIGTAAERDLLLRARQPTPPPVGGRCSTRLPRSKRSSRYPRTGAIVRLLTATALSATSSTSCHHSPAAASSSRRAQPHRRGLDAAERSFGRNQSCGRRRRGRRALAGRHGVAVRGGLCRWLNGTQLRGTSVLELGSGTGVGGMYAAGLGAREVLPTDGVAGLAELQRANIRQNGTCCRSSARSRARSCAGAATRRRRAVGLGDRSACTVEVADETMVALAATCAACGGRRRAAAADPRARPRPNPTRAATSAAARGRRRRRRRREFAAVAAAASREGLGLRQLRYDRPTEEEGERALRRVVCWRC